MCQNEIIKKVVSFEIANIIGTCVPWLMSIKKQIFNLELYHSKTQNV